MGQRRGETFSLHARLLCWVFLHLVCVCVRTCERVSLALCVSVTLWGTFLGCDWGRCLCASAWGGACGGVCEGVRALWGLRVCAGVGVVHLRMFPSPSVFVSGVLSDRGGLLSTGLCPSVGVFCRFGCACGDVLVKDV